MGGGESLSSHYIFHNSRKKYILLTVDGAIKINKYLLKKKSIMEFLYFLVHPNYWIGHNEALKHLHNNFTCYIFF